MKTFKLQSYKDQFAFFRQNAQTDHKNADRLS